MSESEDKVCDQIVTPLSDDNVADNGDESGEHGVEEEPEEKATGDAGMCEKHEGLTSAQPCERPQGDGRLKEAEQPGEDVVAAAAAAAADTDEQGENMLQTEQLDKAAAHESGDCAVAAANNAAFDAANNAAFDAANNAAFDAANNAAFDAANNAAFDAANNAAFDAANNAAFDAANNVAFDAAADDADGIDDPAAGINDAAGIPASQETEETTPLPEAADMLEAHTELNKPDEASKEVTDCSDGTVQTPAANDEQPSAHVADEPLQQIPSQQQEQQSVAEATDEEAAPTTSHNEPDTPATDQQPVPDTQLGNARETDTTSSSDATDNADDNTSTEQDKSITATQPPAPQRRKGYQESRRYDRDRRDNWRKSDKKMDSGGDSSAAQSDTRIKPSVPTGSRDKDNKAGEGIRHSSAGVGAKYKESRSRGEVAGKKNVTTATRDGRSSGADKDHDKDRADSDSGNQLLNLLQKPASSSSKPSDKWDKGRSGAAGRGSRTTSGGEELKGRGGKTASDLEAQWQKEEAERKKKEKREEEKRSKEEAEQRLKEEEIRRAEEAKRLAEVEAARLLQEEQQQLEEYISEVEERIKFKDQLKTQNKAAVESRADELNCAKLDSSLKKNTGFVKKLRNLTEGQKDGLMREFNGLNLSKYVGEAAAALVEAKLKMTDVPCALELCSAMHRRYADFSASLLENWHKVLLNKKDEKVPNPSKLRVDLRLFAELIAVGVFTEREGLGVLANQLTLLVTHDKDEHKNLTVLLSFCRHCGDDYAGIVPRKYRLLAEKYGKQIPRSQVLRAERQRACSKLLRDYFASLSKHIEKDHKELRSMEKHNRKILQTKGELSEERQAKQEAALLTFNKLHSNAAILADLLDESLPELPEEEIKIDPDSMGLDIYSPSKASEYQYDGDNNLFEDEDTRQFYENLPDLKAVIPGILYKDSEQSLGVGAEQTDTMDEDDIKVEDVEMELEQGMEREADSDRNSVGEAKSQEVGSDTEEPEILAADVEEEEQEAGSTNMKVQVENYLAKLTNCVNREIIDKAAIEFCMSLNTKLNRKKLVRALFTVHRTRYDLLPFYGRLVATLCPCMPDVAADLVSFLKGDFRWHVRKKDQINIESKLKSVRYIGELVKFKMFPKAEALHCLKTLLADFSHHNIEMACSLLEACGRYLYRSPDSHHRTKVYLEVMLRKKAALHLDSRYATLIENAYYYSNPPTYKAEIRPKRPPIQQYIRKLLYKDLNKLNVEKVLRQMRKLNWEDSEICGYATKCLVGVWNIRYSVIHCCANLLAGLAPYHENVAIHVVDGVLEDIRLGMEVNLPKMNQRRISVIKFLGELYNYRMLESTVIFKTLYSFITFGITLDDDVPSILDPPEHMFRVRMVCTLLDTCGQYFDRGSSKRKLDCFLVYFQRYYWYKRQNPIWDEFRPFPMEIEYTVEDTIQALRPKLTQCGSYQAACQQAQQLDKEFRSKLVSILPEQEAEGDGLSSIQEVDDADEGLSQYDMTGGDSEDEEDGERGRPRVGHSSTLSPSQSQTGGDRHTGEREAGRVSGEDATGDDDVLDSAGEEENDDQVLVLTGGPRLLKCQEDDDFMTAFDKMITENITARSQETVKVPQVDIVVPVHVRAPRSKPIPTLPGLMSSLSTMTHEPGNDDEAEQIHQPDSTIQFTLMTKKGNKPQFCNLNIPANVSFASKLKEREVVERQEKERMKRMTLDIHERQEEEAYQEMLASLNRPMAPNVNRERRVKYQHPKGAPDADEIFGSKYPLLQQKSVTTRDKQ